MCTGLVFILLYLFLVLMRHEPLEYQDSSGLNLHGYILRCLYDCLHIGACGIVRSPTDGNVSYATFQQLPVLWLVVVIYFYTVLFIAMQHQGCTGASMSLVPRNFVSM